jgi:RNA polymerase sigma-70 factor (ECF subfamily)
VTSWPHPSPEPSRVPASAAYGPPGFEEFFRHYLIWLEAEPGAQEDAVQLTMISAYRYWDRVGQMDPPTGWLFKVAGQRLWDARAADRRNGTLGAERLHEEAAAPDDPFTACDQRLDILAAIRKLPDRQKQAIALREQFGLKYKQIAEIMGAGPARR